MKVLILNGSPRAEGNTSAAVNEIVKILEAENIPVYKLDGAIGVHLPGLGGSKVYVRGCDLDRAERILKEIESGQDKAPSSNNCLNGERDT